MHIDVVDIQACRFIDLKDNFLSTCSTSLPGKGRQTKHHGVVSRPKVAEQYLSVRAANDVHNHALTESMEFKEAW